MEQSEASQHIGGADKRDHLERVERLVELASLLPEEGLIGFSGQAAQWLFEDVKATWLYGCFMSTVLTAHAFCSLQLANSIRLLPDDPGLPDEARSLEHLSAIAVERDIIDIDLQARLVELHDRYVAYTRAHLHQHEGRFERHLIEAEMVQDEHPLLLDARNALTTAVQLVYRGP